MQHLYMLRAYIHAEGLDDKYAGLKRYHLSTAAQGTFNDKNEVREVIVKACKYQIATRYGGDEDAFMRHATIPQIEEPFYERICGRRFRVSTKSAMVHFGESTIRIKRAYMRHRDGIALEM